MAKLVITGTIEAAPGKRDQLLSSLTAHGSRCLRDEPGTLQFEVMVSREDDSKLLVYEVYRDDATFEEHRRGPSNVQFGEETAGLGLKVAVTFCTPVELDSK